MSESFGNAIARGAAALTAAAGSLGGGLRAALNAYADFLARISWGRFFVLAILGLIAVGIVDSLLRSGTRAINVTEGTFDETIKLRVRMDADGEVDVSAARVPRGKGGEANDLGSAGGERREEAAAQPEKDRADVRIDKDGVRIEAKEASGESSVVVIDLKGLRLQNRQSQGKDKREPDAAIAPLETVPPEANSPTASQWVEATNRRIAEANQRIAASHTRTQQIVTQIQERAEQAVNRELAGMSVKRIERGRIPGILVPLYMVLFFASAILKIVGADRKQAVARAGAAEADAERETLRRQVVEARLQALQAQIEPHFLFNTLGSVEYLIETDTARAGAMLKSLIQYLRAALPRMRSQSTTLGPESELVRVYLEILKFRMEERLNYRIDVPVGLASAQFPPMMLQSIVENSIKHGLEPKTDGGTITLLASIADGGLHVTVADTGLGLGLSPVAGTGLGLSNVRERLYALYGDRGKLVIESIPSGGTVVRIEIPYSASPEPQPEADRNETQLSSA